MRDGHLLRRIGSEFVKTLAWILVLFGPLFAAFVFAAGVPPIGLMAGVGIFLVAVAAIVAVMEL